VRAIREQIVAALDVIVQIARLVDGRRRVTHVSEICGIDPETDQVVTEDIFILPSLVGKTGGSDSLMHTGYIPRFSEQLIKNKFLDVEVFT
jgi:pilus assembly protein CpaF